MNRFWLVFSPFNHLEPFWSQKNGSKRPKMGPKWAKNRSFGGDFVPFLDRSGSLWDHFGIILGSFCRFDPILRPFWAFLAHFYCHFAIFWWCFGELAAKLSKMMQGKANIIKFLPNFTKTMQNCAKKKPFSPIKHLFCFKK